VTRVLVTGASGFVGSPAVTALLAGGHEVHAASSRPHDADTAISWHAADLLQPQAAGQLIEAVRPEWLLHMAWYAEHGRFWDSPLNLEWVEATLRLMRAFIAAGGRRAVLAGTCAEYAWDREIYSEHDAALAPATLYGAAKNSTRALTEALAAEAGIDVAWGRLFFLYGPGEAQTRLVPSVVRALLCGEPAPVTEGDQVRDFMHVADAGAAFAALLASDVRGAVNIASGTGVAVRQLVELLGAATGRGELIQVGALAGRADEPASLIADVGRLRDEVGFAPRHALAEGIADTVAWWRERLAA
jgi:nucleoside-diphosphate-sugar epimerase